MKRLTLALLAIVVLALCSSAVDALAATGIVLAGPLNVRAGPGTSYAVVGRLSTGATIDVRGQNAAEDWLYVCCTADKRPGWVARRYIGQPFAARVPVVDRTGYPVSPLALPERTSP